MANRHYYSVRTGLNRDGIQFDLGALRRYLRGTYDGLRESGHFQESFGYFCVDEGHVPGLLGSDVETKVAIALRKQDIWLIADHVDDYSEDDCFDVIEFLYDTVSSPVDGWFHQFSGCGWHYSTFDREAGRAKLREEVNAMLRDYQSGWEMSEDGEILALADPGLQTLFEASLPRLDPPRVEDRVTTAIRKFRTRGATTDDWRDAVRDLADVLEFLRPRAAKHILTKKDENDLFQIANRFGVRHNDEAQKIEYDRDIWYAWMFYYYLATIHAAMRVITKAEGKA